MTGADCSALGVVAERGRGEPLQGHFKLITPANLPAIIWGRITPSPRGPVRPIDRAAAARGIEHGPVHPGYAEGQKEARSVRVDPTRIDIDFDPMSQHMVGVSAHGLMSFDVPFISEMVPNLWLGGCEDGLVLPTFIKHLVSLYPWEKYTVNHDLDSSLIVRMYDSTDQAFDQVDAIARWVNDSRDWAPTLVHCQAGLNRSSLVVVRALMLGGMPVGEAIALVREKRSPACLSNPSFERWLRAQS